MFLYICLSSSVYTCYLLESMHRKVLQKKLVEIEFKIGLFWFKFWKRYIYIYRFINLKSRITERRDIPWLREVMWAAFDVTAGSGSSGKCCDASKLHCVHLAFLLHPPSLFLPELLLQTGSPPATSSPQRASWSQPLTVPWVSQNEGEFSRGCGRVSVPKHSETRKCNTITCSNCS